MGVQAWLSTGAAVAVLGAASGAALGATGHVDFHRYDPAVEVAYHTCPGQAVAGTLHGGDRVFAVGRDQAGEWVVIRSPRGLQAEAWMKADTLDPDGDFGTLRVLRCGAPGEAAAPPKAGGAGGESPMPATAVPGTASPTKPDRPATSATSTVPAKPSDLRPPEIGAVSADRSQVWEDGPSCVRLPTTAEVSVVVTDESDVEDVTLGWSAGGASGSTGVERTGGDTWVATVGPFPVGSVSGSSPVELTVRAEDAAGNQASDSESGALTLEACP